nr:probable envelope ADP,ATP carrier protein, chloroplastic [Tanacetum cinerariifolium]
MSGKRVGIVALVPLDRTKLIMQTHGLRVGQESAMKAIGFAQALVSVGKQEGLKGYLKGNFAQVQITPFTLYLSSFFVPKEYFIIDLS